MGSDKSAGTNQSGDFAQARLAAIVASSDDGMITRNLEGLVDTWNSAAERIFGYSAEEMIGKSLDVLLPPEGPDEEAKILDRVRRGERVDHFQTIRIAKDGRRVPVWLTISAIVDAGGRIVGTSNIVRDVTRSTEVERLFSAIVESSDDAIVSKDLTGTVRSWNVAAERIFGFTASEMIGQPILKIIPKERWSEETDILNRLRRGERVDHFETVRQRKDGTLIDVSVTISPIKDTTGRVIGASKIARDISALKQYVKEREQLLESEHAARKEAERVNRMKDEFLATLSHELRTPLNAIMGWSQLLRSGGGRPGAHDLRDGLEAIDRNARVQTQLIEDLLDMSRIVSGKLRLDVQQVDLSLVVRAAIESMQPAADARGVRVATVLDPRAGPVTGDPNRLQQVFWNLLSNAIKFTPRGGRVQVNLRRIDSHVEIAVSDTGEGISADFLPYVFSRFAQADQTTTRHHGGLGLGLAIVKHLLELHGGTVRAESAGKGKGTTFTVSLPLSAVLVQQEAEPPRSERTTPAGAVGDAANAAGSTLPLAIDLSGVRVLVVDDEPDARAMVTRVLETHGASVDATDSTTRALDQLKKQPPNLVLCDIGMPGEDGYQFLAKLRRLEPAEGGDTPVVALTAFARPEDRRRALLAGFQMHLPKPVETAELLAVVASLSGITRRDAVSR
ncbi:MAG TPA: PAS domain S-box protein [Tepidisphaeraceae bacterium]